MAAMPCSSLLPLLVPIRVLNNFLFLQKKKSSSVGSSRKRDAAAGSGNGGWCQTLRAPRPGAYADVFGVEFARTHARGAARLRDCFRVSVQIRAAAPAGHAVFWPAGFIGSFFLIFNSPFSFDVFARGIRLTG